MFGFFRHRAQPEQLIAEDRLERAAERFGDILSSKLPTKEIAYQFIEELDGANRGNAAICRVRSHLLKKMHD